MIPPTTEIDKYEWNMGGNPISQKESAEYLGVMAKSTGTNDKRSAARINTAKIFLTQMTRSGIKKETFNIICMSRLCKTFIIPKASYAIHLTELDEKTKKQW